MDGAARAILLLQSALNGVEGRRIDDRRMLARMARPST